MRLPIRGLEQFLGACSARPLQEVEDRGGFTALAGVVSCAPGRFLLRGGLVPRLGFGGRNLVIVMLRLGPPVMATFGPPR
jgi:hypothetical protein